MTVRSTVLADSSHGDSHVGSVSPAATRTRTLALTLTHMSLVPTVLVRTFSPVVLFPSLVSVVC